MKIKWYIWNRWYHLKVTIHKFLVNHTNIPICHGCWGPCFRKGKKRRQYTHYVDDKMNWVFMCDKCSEENDQRWAGLWNEYYVDLL